MTEQQWLQVRTGAFKQWFGDWEKVARFNSAVQQLLSMSEVASITGTEFAPDGRKLTDKVTEFWNKEYGGVAKNPVLGDVVLDTRSVKASIAHGVGRLKSAAFAVVHDVIERGVLVVYHGSQKKERLSVLDPKQGYNIDAIWFSNRADVASHWSGRSSPVRFDDSLKEKLNALDSLEKIADFVEQELYQNEIAQYTTREYFTRDLYASPNPFEHVVANLATKLDRAKEEVLWWMENAEQSPGNTYACFVSLKNPLEVDAKGSAFYQISFSPIGQEVDTESIAVYAKENGYDGVIVRNVKETDYANRKSDDFIIQNAAQAKSATDNRGTFDGSSPDITFSVVGENAANWEKIKDRAFVGRDDGKLRVEIDASGAKIKAYPKEYPVYEVMRKLIHSGVYDSDEHLVYSSLKFIEDITETEKGEKKLNETELKEDTDRFPDLAAEVERGLKAAGLTWESDIQAVRGACFTALSKWKKKLEEELKGLNIEKPEGEAWHALVEQKPGLASVNSGKRIVSSWSGKRLDDVLDFPELFEAYPQLRNIQLAEDFGIGLADASYAEFAAKHGVSVGKNEGQYPLGFINMNPTASAWSDERKATSLLLHEIQHAIQDIEGFAKGANNRNGMDAYMRSAGEIEARNVQLRRDWTAEQRAARPFNDTLEYPGEALVSFSVSDTLMEDIRRAAYNKIDSRERIHLCTMPTVLRMMGEPDGDVYTLPGTISKLVYTHNLAHPEVYRAVEELDDPLFVFKDTANSYLFVLEMQATNNKGVKSNVAVAIQVKRSESGHYLLSAYPLDALDKIVSQSEQKHLVYSKYTDSELNALLNKQTTPPTDGASVFFQSALVRSAVKGGLTPTVKTKSDLVKYKVRDAGDFSSSLVNMDEESVAREVVDAGQGFRANLAYSEAIMREMRGAMQRLRRLGSKTRTDREDAVAAMGTMVQMVKAAVAYLPQGYRFSVHPYLNRIEALAELAATGDIDLTSDISSKDILQLENAEGVDLKKPYDEMVKEYGNVKLAAALERIMHRVSEQLRKHAKDRAVEKIMELVERLAPKKDPKTGKLKGGKMSADAYRDLATVAEAMKMNAEQLEAKLAALRADLAKPGISEALRAQLEDEMTLYDQFGDLAGMTPEDAVAAYEALRVRVYFHRFEWDDKQARVRGARRAVVRRVVDGVGTVSENEYNAKKRRVKPSQRLKNLGDILSGMPAALAGMRGYLPLRQMADELALRANAAGEAIKAWEAERWLALEALSKETMGKSWRECMDFMHKVQPSGVSFDRPKFRTVNVKTEELRELLAMTKEERKAEMKRRREAGGLEAERALSERDVQELQKKLEAMEEEGRVLSRVETRYMVEVQHEENLQLSRGEALYAILMFEQPTYTERLIMQGYTFEVIEGLREYVGDGMLQFGYGLRELFAQQGDRIAAVYEAAFGVPFPREENYFAARWVVNGMKENPAEQLLAGMAGTAGAGNGWMKQRVNHNLELDMTKDALQVFLQATSLTDTWMATQEIVADFKAWTRDADFERALTVTLGKESYDNLKDWIRILEMGGVQDCLNMGASQDVINGLYGSGAVAILGLRVQTLLKQTPSIFNGLLGAPDISVAEWMLTLARMKRGEAPMTYAKMKNSVLLKSRQQGRAGNMASQAVRSNDSESSVTEELLLASMLPMEWVDASCTAMSLVPVWNIYYQRAVEKGVSHAEAERAAWEQTTIVANLASQPIGILNRSKVTQNRSSIVKAAFFMLSESTAKFAMCRALWKGRNKMAAVRAWLVYGAANAAISALLDYLQGDPDEWEKGEWWEYMLSAAYGPLASIPGMGELVEELGTLVFFTLPGHVFDIEELKKAKTSASVGRALVDVQGGVRGGRFTDSCRMTRSTLWRSIRGRRARCRARWR